VGMMNFSCVVQRYKMQKQVISKRQHIASVKGLKRVTFSNRFGCYNWCRVHVDNSLFVVSLCMQTFYLFFVRISSFRLLIIIFSAWLKSEDHPVIARINARIGLMTNLNMDTAEELQVYMIVLNDDS